eukprot:scaffold42926_cov47-Phaeocystis_antarctica.AAC.2
MAWMAIVSTLVSLSMVVPLEGRWVRSTGRRVQPSLIGLASCGSMHLSSAIYHIRPWPGWPRPNPNPNPNPNHNPNPNPNQVMAWMAKAATIVARRQAQLSVA